MPYIFDGIEMVISVEKLLWVSDSTHGVLNRFSFYKKNVWKNVNIFFTNTHVLKTFSTGDHNRSLGSTKCWFFNHKSIVID